MDLLKVFDTINHELLVVKLNAYEFDKDPLEIMRNYLSNRWQRTKINTTFSSWSTLLEGVPQDSVLGPILSNIFLNDLFFVLKDTDVCNFADDTSRHACDISFDERLMRLERDFALAVCWFESKYMKLNTDKYHLIVSGNKHENLWADIVNDRIWETNYVRFLRINIDISFHMLKVFSKANRKLTILTRMFKFLTFEKRRVLVKAYFESQFKFCPLVSMFHGRQVNKKINQLHERPLKMIYENSTSLSENLLEKDMSFSVHDRNIN